MEITDKEFERFNKEGFIILDGKALVQIGIYKSSGKRFGSLSRLVFRPGLFHSIKAISKKGFNVKNIFLSIFRF